jgi:LysM repeat protein
VPSALKSIPAKPPAQAAAKPLTALRYHVVKKNETLSSIARLYNIPLRELCRHNDLAPGTKIPAGIKLKIANNKPSQQR